MKLTATIHNKEKIEDIIFTYPIREAINNKYI